MAKLDLIEIVGAIVESQGGIVEAMSAGDDQAMAGALLRLSQEAMRQFVRLSGAAAPPDAASVVIDVIGDEIERNGPISTPPAASAARDDAVLRTRADTPVAPPVKRTCEHCFHWRKPPGRGRRTYVCQSSVSPRGNQPTGAAETCDCYVRDPGKGSRTKARTKAPTKSGKGA